jgi:glycosyltransferase involved in cell wall biosynthesis
MKILLLSDFYPPYRGGMEQHVQSLAHHLALRGHTVSVATTTAPATGMKSEQSSVSIHTVPGVSAKLPFLNRDHNRPYPVPMPDPLLHRGLKALIARLAPDVIHSHGWSTFTALHLGLPLVATLHDYGLFCPKRTLLRGDSVCREGPGLRCIGSAREQYGLAKSAAVFGAMQIGRRSLRRGRVFIAVSSFVRDMYLQFTNLSPKQIELIPNFYGNEEFPRAGPTTIAPLPPRYILFLGYLARYKGIHVLLEAYSKLETDIPLVIIGYPDEKLVVTDPRVIVIEGVPHTEALHALSQCLFAVVPSIVPESFGMVALEAMSQGKAVIASSVGGLPDIVKHRETGLLVPPGDAIALGANMVELLEDPDFRQQLGAAGLRRLNEEFSPNVIVPRIEAAYKQAI